MKKIILFFILLHTMLLSSENLKKISIQFMWHDQYEFAGFYMAKEKGYYKDAGLEVSFKKFTIDTDIVEKVISGEATFGTGSSSLIIDKSNGKDIVLLGTVFQSSPLILLGLKRDDLQKIEDIKNKKIMLTTNQQRFATLRSMLASKNVQLDDINIIKHSFNVDDLINKKTDLMLAYTTNEPYILKEKGYESKIFHPKDYGFDFYEEFIFTSNSFAKKNPKIVDAFYKATVKGWEYAFNNIDEVAKIVHDRYNPQNKTLDSLIFEANEMKKLAYTKDGEFGIITEEKINLTKYSYRVLGYLKNDVKINDLIYTIKKDEGALLTKYERQYLDINKHVKMCIDPNWMPFEKNDNGKHIGISADYIELISKSINSPIKMVPTKDWTQSLEFGKERKCDIFSLAMDTPKRREYLNFTNTYLEIPLVLAANVDAPFIESLNDIKDKNIGIVKGYAIYELLKIKYPNINFIEVPNIKDGLRQVKNGIIYGFIDTLITVAYEIQNDYIGNLKIAGKFEDTFELAIGIRNDRPILNSIFNKAIETITPEQRKTILNKWSSITYEKKIDYTVLYIILFFLLTIIVIFSIVYKQYVLKQANEELNRKVKEEIDKNNKQHKILTQHTKKVAMGEMLENIAHQWRQPLSVISVAASGIRMKKEYGILKDDELLESVDSINESAQFLSKTIDDFRDFSSETKITNEFYIKDPINKSLQLFGIHFNNYNISVVENISNTKINTVENELIQVLINILNNSKDALESIKNKKLIIIETFEKDNKLIIKLKDSANGIPEDILDKIFEPYFTTKHKSQGTGIGLYMSEQIITNHMKGTIEVSNETFTYENSKFKGACFQITIPLSF